METSLLQNVKEVLYKKKKSGLEVFLSHQKSFYGNKKPVQEKTSTVIIIIKLQSSIT